MTYVLIAIAVVAVLAIFFWKVRVRVVSQATPAVRQAILQQPDTVTLTRCESPQWRNVAMIEGLANELAGDGFTEVGTFSVDKMPGVLLRMMVHSGANVVANLYDHPKGGIWTELVTRYEDGSWATATTLPDKGVPRPGWIRTFRHPGASAGQLYRELVQQRPAGAMKVITAANGAADFEQGYLSYMTWLKNRDLSSVDVLRMVQKRSAS